MTFYRRVYLKELGQLFKPNKTILTRVISRVCEVEKHTLKFYLTSLQDERFNSLFGKKVKIHFPEEGTIPRIRLVGMVLSDAKYYAPNKKANVTPSPTDRWVNLRIDGSFLWYILL